MHNYDDGSGRNELPDNFKPRNYGGKKPSQAQDPQPTPQLYDAYALMRRPVRPLEWLVPDIFPRYCFLVGADAKAGKSRLFLTAALKVCTSTPEVGAPPKILYLSPDNTDMDQWTRDINDLLDGTPLDPGRLLVMFKKVQLDEGLIPVIEQILEDDPAIVGVIVDVYNSVKPDKRKTDDIQKADHGGMRDFAELAERRKIGLALLTHTNVHGQIAGSMGLRGGVHAIMKLEREHPSNHVDVLLYGRGIPQDIQFGFELPELCVEWTPAIIGEGQDTGPDLDTELQLAAQEREAEAARKLPRPPGPKETVLLQQIGEVGAGPQGSWSCRALTDATGMRYATVRKYCRRMLQRGRVTAVCGGFYGPVTTVTTVTQTSRDTSNPSSDAPAIHGPSPASPLASVTVVTPVTIPPPTSPSPIPLFGQQVWPRPHDTCSCGACMWGNEHGVPVCRRCKQVWRAQT